MDIEKLALYIGATSGVLLILSKFLAVYRTVQQMEISIQELKEEVKILQMHGSSNLRPWAQAVTKSLQKKGIEIDSSIFL